MKKQIVAGVCSVVMMGAFAFPVHATEQTTTLNANVGSTYTLTIPASTQDLTYGKETTTLSGKLKVTGNVETMEKVEVTTTINPLTDSNQNTIPFNLYTTGTTTPFTSATWSETELRATPAKEIELEVNIPASTWQSAKAGDYTGSIVFKAALTD